MAAVFAWGFAVGYVVAKLIEMAKGIVAARREANRKVAEARDRTR